MCYHDSRTETAHVAKKTPFENTMCHHITSTETLHLSTTTKTTIKKKLKKLNPLKTNETKP